MDRQEASLRRTKVLFGQLHQTENEEMKEMTEISPTDCYGSSITEEMSTLLQERANCPFDVSKISEMLYGIFKKKKKENRFSNLMFFFFQRRK